MRTSALASKASVSLLVCVWLMCACSVAQNSCNTSASLHSEEAVRNTFFHYGNFCGPGPELLKGCRAPLDAVDNVDAVCMRHDQNWCRCYTNVDRKAHPVILSTRFMTMPAALYRRLFSNEFRKCIMLSDQQMIFEFDNLTAHGELPEWWDAFTQAKFHTFLLAFRRSVRRDAKMVEADDARLSSERNHSFGASLLAGWAWGSHEGDSNVDGTSPKQQQHRTRGQRELGVLLDAMRRARETACRVPLGGAVAMEQTLLPPEGSGFEGLVDENGQWWDDEEEESEDGQRNYHEPVPTVPLDPAARARDDAGLSTNSKGGIETRRATSREFPRVLFRCGRPGEDPCDRGPL